VRSLCEVVVFDAVCDDVDDVDIPPDDSDEITDDVDIFF
jgi:hypothetical protein